jgi:hypothetical protein
MIPLALEGLLIRTADPQAVVVRYLDRGAVLVAPLADFGWFSGARMSVDGMTLSIVRFGPLDHRIECSIMFATKGGAPGLRQHARDLDLKASAAIHSAIAQHDGFPVAWWTVLLFGLLDSEPRLPANPGGILTGLSQTLLGTNILRRAAAARARGPAVLMRSFDTRPLPLPSRARIRVETGSFVPAWRRLLIRVHATGHLAGGEIDLISSDRARIAGLSRADGSDFDLS